MNIERAFERRAKMLARIEQELKFGVPLPSEDRECPNAAYGLHGDPNWQGRCPYCDQVLVRKFQRPNIEPRRNVLDEKVPKHYRRKEDLERTNIDPTDDD